MSKYDKAECCERIDNLVLMVLAQLLAARTKPNGTIVQNNIVLVAIPLSATPQFAESKR
jgi:hypothetical protein